MTRWGGPIGAIAKGFSVFPIRYDAKVKSEMMKNFKLHDDVHPRKNLLYQMPTHEYYNMFRGPLVEHMIYYLVKTGGDARTFPELMPHKWFNQIYETKVNLLLVLILFPHF